MDLCAFYNTISVVEEISGGEQLLEELSTQIVLKVTVRG